VDSLLIDTPSYVLALLLAGAMSLVSAFSWRHARRRIAAGDPPTDKFTDAGMALLGLLLAFTFGMSLDKYNKRRLMVVADANAIGDFYTCASLQKEPVRSKLRSVVREYTEHRLAFARDRHPEDHLGDTTGEVRAFHTRMEEQVKAALDDGTPIATPLVNTLNALTSSHVARVAAVRDHLPTAIVALLFLTSIVTAFLAGGSRGRLTSWFGGSVAGFILLVSFVVCIILDLNQPRHGLIRLDQGPVEQVLAGMG
jgi:hypothetical protein